MWLHYPQCDRTPAYLRWCCITSGREYRGVWFAWLQRLQVVVLLKSRVLVGIVLVCVQCSVCVCHCK